MLQRCTGFSLPRRPLKSLALKLTDDGDVMEFICCGCWLLQSEDEAVAEEADDFFCDLDLLVFGVPVGVMVVV